MQNFKVFALARPEMELRFCPLRHYNQLQLSGGRKITWLKQCQFLHSNSVLLASISKVLTPYTRIAAPRAFLYAAKWQS